ncbi:hypothetical protein [Hyphomicrobium sp.]|uniref:hypothetical protein n=1 Tax=Hyphomicrobium sp. TaxID=82 RepID=UPI002FDCF3BA
MIGDSVEYSPELREEELREILEWFVAATNLMKDLAREIPGHGKDPALTLCSRDFSIEALIEPNEKHEGADPVRVSFCPLRQGKVGPHYVVNGSFKVGSADVVQIVTVPSSKDEIASPAIAARLRDIIERTHAG